MEKNIEIHETAFMTSMFRAMNVSLSKDSYSKLWNNRKTKAWVTDYLKEVSEEEISTHCVRNRFFLDKIQQLFKEHNIEILINFGAGFSMYPFLLNASLEHIEIDKSDIIEHKKNRISNWMKVGELPKRKIHFLGADFEENYEEELYTKIQTIKNNKKSFVLIEGVLFFLHRDKAEKLFDFFNNIQNKGDYLGSVSFSHSIKETNAFSRLLHFFNARISKTTKEDYLTLQTNFYKEKLAYKIKEHKDYFTYSKEVNHSVNKRETDILNENFYLLEKTK